MSRSADKLHEAAQDWVTRTGCSRATLSKTEIPLRSRIKYIEYILSDKPIECLYSVGFDILCDALNINSITLHFDHEAKFAEEFSKYLEELPDDAATVICVCVGNIPLGDDRDGHAFTIYIDKGVAALIDNNGSKYDDVYACYLETKSCLIASLKDKTDLDIWTNSNPTYNKKGICAFAAIETATRLQSLDNEEVADLFKQIERADTELLNTLFPTEDIKDLPFASKQLRDHLESVKKEAATSLGMGK